jgi:hypothetical protein
MMRRNIWSIGLIVSALSALLWTTAVAQPPCCDFRVRHNFKLCLNNCPFQLVQWNWFTQASVWNPLVTNTNASMAAYHSIPTSDIKCAAVTAQNNCAHATACTRFGVNWHPFRNCILGFHEAFGSTCANCFGFGAQAIAKGHLIFNCGTPGPFGFIWWQPSFSDTVAGQCWSNLPAEIHDPVVLKLRNPATGETRDEVLFDLRARGIICEYEDLDGDGWGDRSYLSFTSHPPRDVWYEVKKVQGSDSSRLRLRVRDGIVVESENSGEFANLRWPSVGQQVPPRIEVPATFELVVEVPPDWELDEIEMGGGGESGDTPPPSGDVNGDGCVDDADLLAVLFAFGQTGSGLPEDVNGDGVVDDADLLTVLFAFGQGC